MAPKRQTKRTSSHRSTLSLQKTEIIINVYDLLSPGRFSSFLWAVGTSLLHSGVVINGREYAYGGHDRPGVTGVYWTTPRTQPPGGTFRCEILHGFSFSPQNEIDDILREASEEFKGTSYNLLTKNCNHFTAVLCQRLTGRTSPGWLNRAASIGVALPCMVPRDWLEPPDYENTDGSLLDDDDDDEHAAEQGRMLPHQTEELHLLDSNGDDATPWVDEDNDLGRSGRGKGRGKPKALLRDSAGWALPPSELAPSARRP